jgi:hypothetical protein
MHDRSCGRALPINFQQFVGGASPLVFFLKYSPKNETGLGSGRDETKAGRIYRAELIDSSALSRERHERN